MSTPEKVACGFILAGALICGLGHVAVGIIVIACGLVVPRSVSR